MPSRRLRTCLFVSRDDSCRKDSRQQRRAAIAREAILISALESGNYRCTLGRYKYTLEYREPNNTYRRRSLCRALRTESSRENGNTRARGTSAAREKNGRKKRERKEEKKKKKKGRRGRTADTIRFFIGNRRAMTGSNTKTPIHISCLACHKRNLLSSRNPILRRAVRPIINIVYQSYQRVIVFAFYCAPRAPRASL